jgi:dTDP-4-dehydrorhamnose 3,5-epimerase
VKVTPTRIPDVLLVEPVVHRDARGFFFESYEAERFRAAGIACTFVQDNHARSLGGTLRGLHYQRAPGQDKLVRCTRGRIWDVAVDIRPGSPTFAAWVAAELGEDDHHMLFVPIGFAHGYVALSDVAEVQYKVSHRYVPAEEAGIAWDDPDVAIRWPVASPILSARDRGNPRLREVLPEAFRGR